MRYRPRDARCYPTVPGAIPTMTGAALTRLGATPAVLDANYAHCRCRGQHLHPPGTAVTRNSEDDLVCVEDMRNIRHVFRPKVRVQEPAVLEGHIVGQQHGSGSALGVGGSS